MRKPNIRPERRSGSEKVSLHHLLAIPAVEQTKEFDKQMEFLTAYRSLAKFVD